MIMACDLALFGRRGGCGQHAQMRTWGWHSARAQAARNVQNAELAKSANEDQPEVLNRHLRGTLTARPPALQIQDLRMYAAIRNSPPCALPIIELGSHSIGQRQSRNGPKFARRRRAIQLTYWHPPQHETHGPQDEARNARMQQLSQSKERIFGMPVAYALQCNTLASGGRGCF